MGVEEEDITSLPVGQSNVSDLESFGMKEGERYDEGALDEHG